MGFGGAVNGKGLNSGSTMDNVGCDRSVNYKSRIHGFGNPHFVEKVDNNSTDISQIGSSIVYNAKTGQYNQVVEDLSDLVLIVLPNKLINGLADYYSNIRTVNGHVNRGQGGFGG